MNSRLISPKVLIVDDEPVMRTITQSVLSQLEFSVSMVESAERALEMIDGGYNPDLILLDVLMPGMNSFDTCRLLRKQSKFEHLPIIMLTALDDQESIDEAYRCGATDFITKPINLPLLPHRIRYLLRSAEAFSDLFESRLALIHTQKIARLGNWSMDTEGYIVAASRQFLDITGAATTPISEKQMLELVHREDRELLQSNRQQLVSGRAYRLDYRLRGLSRDKAWQHVHEQGFPNFDANGTYIGASGFTQDITERVAQEERIRDLAWHDRVTGLNNRNRLIELIDRELTLEARHPAMAILYIHFSSQRDISTIFGQEIADSVIKTLADRVKGVLGGHDTGEYLGQEILQGAKLGRFDEHSFVVTLSAEDAREGSRHLARQLIDTLTRPMVHQGENLFITAYIGISFYPEDASDTSELIRRAMLVALHAARSEGSAISFFDPEQDREASERMALERGLHQALEQGNQLHPYFQPKVCARTGEIVGAEVLLRWFHPEFGVISPGQFIPLAEQTGLIHPISEWLIGKVCELIADWRAWNKPIGKISINLSAPSFFQPTLLQFIDEVLERTGVPPEQLVIELTEGVLMQNADSANQVIASLRQRGIGVSLDDFGTGFSSLGYLNRFRIDEIKIDRSFIVDLEEDKTERALTQAIITLGHALGLSVVAEGIETARQAEILREMGCDIFQGFLFARPMPADDFAGFSLAPGG